jgi:hypothetical protein
MSMPSSDGVMHYSAILSDAVKPSLDVIPRVKKNGAWIVPTSALLDFVPEAAETRFVINRSAFNSSDGALQFTDAMTADQFAAMKAKLKQEIIIGDRGNPEEMPLCTLAALLQNDGPNNIFASKDRVAFVIISDEGQTTKLAACPSGHRMTSASINQNAKGVGYALQSTVIMDYQAKCHSTANDTYCGQQPWIQRQHTSCKTTPLCERTVLNGYAPCSVAQRADYLEFFRRT